MNHKKYSLFSSVLFLSGIRQFIAIASICLCCTGPLMGQQENSFENWSKVESSQLFRDLVTSLKANGSKACRFRSCCDLAERNARLWLQGKVTNERFEQLSSDLRNTCETAAIYQDWLVKSDLPLTGKRFHM